MQSIDSTVPTVSNGESCNEKTELSIEFESAIIRSSSKSEADADVKDEAATEVVA